MFGQTIYSNLQSNLSNTKICECCKDRFPIDGKSDRNIYCENCRYEKTIEKNEKYNEKRIKK